MTLSKKITTTLPAIAMAIAKNVCSSRTSKENKQGVEPINGEEMKAAFIFGTGALFLSRAPS